MPETIAQELFGVARNGEVIGELYTDVESASRSLDYYRGAGTAFGIAADELDLVSVQSKTTYGKPKVITPDPPPTSPAPTPEGDEPDDAYDTAVARDPRDQTGDDYTDTEQ